MEDIVDLLARHGVVQTLPSVGEAIKSISCFYCFWWFNLSTTYFILFYFIYFFFFLNSFFPHTQSDSDDIEPDYEAILNARIETQRAKQDLWINVGLIFHSLFVFLSFSDASFSGPASILFYYFRWFAFRCLPFALLYLLFDSFLYFLRFALLCFVFRFLNFIFIILLLLLLSLLLLFLKNSNAFYSDFHNLLGAPSEYIVRNTQYPHITLVRRIGVEVNRSRERLAVGLFECAGNFEAVGLQS